MSDDLRSEVAELELRLDVLRRALRESEPDASGGETDEQRRRRIYYGGGGDGLRRDDVEGGGALGGLCQTTRGKQYGG